MAGIALYVAMSLLYLALGSARTEPIAPPTRIPSCELHWNPHESEQRDSHHGRTEAWLRQVTCQTRRAWQQWWE